MVDVLLNRYIMYNMDKLEEWSGMKYNSVLYDSERDGKDSEVFREKIMNHEHLYFIPIDSDNNVFGHYHPSKITKVDSQNEEKGIFLFTLNSNGRYGVGKFDHLKSIETCTYICGNKLFFWPGHNYFAFYSIWRLDTNKSYINGDDIIKSFKGIENTFVDNYFDKKFTTTRLIVIEMK